MSPVRENMVMINIGSDGHPCWLYFEYQHTNYFKAKIRGFYTTIHGFLLSKFRKKTVLQ